MLTRFYIRAKLFAEKLIHDQRGVTAIEYAIIAVAISTMLLTIFGTGGTLKTALNTAMTAISNNITSAASTAK